MGIGRLGWVGPWCSRLDLVPGGIRGVSDRLAVGHSLGP